MKKFFQAAPRPEINTMTIAFYDRSCAATSSDQCSQRSNQGLRRLSARAAGEMIGLALEAGARRPHWCSSMRGAVASMRFAFRRLGRRCTG